MQFLCCLTPWSWAACWVAVAIYSTSMQENKQERSYQRDAKAGRNDKISKLLKTTGYNLHGKEKKKQPLELMVWLCKIQASGSGWAAGGSQDTEFIKVLFTLIVIAPQGFQTFINGLIQFKDLSLSLSLILYIQIKINLAFGWCHFKQCFLCKLPWKITERNLTHPAKNSGITKWRTKLSVQVWVPLVTKLQSWEQLRV